MQDCELTLKLDELYQGRMEPELLDFYLRLEVMPLYREVTIPMERKGIPVDVEELRRADFEIKQELERLESEILVTLAPMLGQFNRKYLNKLYPPKTGGKFAQTVAKLLRVDLPRTKAGAFSLAKKAIESLPSWHLFRQFIEGRSELPQSLILKAQLELNGGEPQLNLASKDQLRYVFFTILKEKPTSFTDRGVPQVNEEFLASVQHKYEFGPKLLIYNKLSKIKSSYIERFLEEQEDGIFYPRFQQHRTTTGRYGGDLQQLPRALEAEDEPSALVRNFTNRVRQFFIAGPGYKLVDADYNSLEVVVFADDAGDESLLDMIRKDEDFYSKVALQVHGLEGTYSADKKAPNYLKISRPKLRQDAKVSGLGIRYNHMLNSALNHAIQSFAASIVNRASIALAREMRERELHSYICMNVHDELCVRAPESEVDVVAPLMQKIMETTTILDAPLTAKPEVAYTYGDVK
jgi:DNA polymerase I-like protein with 3'-5' exonuclease and polymerase domains